MPYPKREPLPKRTNNYTLSQTVTVPGGLTARVQTNRTTGHTRWNAQRTGGLDRTFTGVVIDGRFFPHSIDDANYIATNFRRRRRPSLYDGTYHPWKE